MVSPVFTAPPANRALYSTTTDTGQEDLQRQASVLVGQSMSILRDMMRKTLTLHMNDVPRAGGSPQ